MPAPIIVLVIPFMFVLLWWVFGSRGLQKNKQFLPPGPPAEPIIGHMRLVPRDRPDLMYVKWGKEYNTDILYLNLLGKHVIILNSVEAATELLEKKGAKNSARPDLFLFEEQGWGPNLGFLTTGSAFRLHRKMFQNAFTATNCIPYREAQQAEARKVVAQILAAPHDWQPHLVLFAITVILRISYGITAKEDDEYVEMAKKASHILDESGGFGTTILDIFPSLRYLPQWLNIVPTLKLARGHRPFVRALHEIPFVAVKNAMANGVAETSFVKKMLEEKSEQKDAEAQLTETDISGAAATIYTAGQDTTWTTLTMFVLNLTENPEIQKKAWAEIESVVGTDRLPTFADRDKLPYIECILDEVFRRFPAAPLGVPHKASEDGTYKGYFIPKVANAYAMLRDERTYKDPEAFNPDRYLPVEKGGLGEPLPIGQFGFGRRVCPGRHLASASVWITMATMLATLEISRPKDINGNDIIQIPSFDTGVITHPRPFRTVIKPRNSKAAELLGQA